MPECVSKQLSFALMRDLRLEAGGPSLQDQFLEHAHAVFRQADTDQSGGLDQQELVQVR